MQTQYLDRLLLTPVRRTAILIGHMAADVRVAAALTVPILVLGVVLGVRFEGGLLGRAGFHPARLPLDLAFAGFGYAIALKTGKSDQVAGDIRADIASGTITAHRARSRSLSTTARPDDQLTNPKRHPMGGGFCAPPDRFLSVTPAGRNWT